MTESTFPIADLFTVDDLSETYYKVDTSSGAGTMVFTPSATDESGSPVTDISKAYFGVGYYFYVKEDGKYSKVQRIGGHWVPSECGAKMNTILPKTQTNLFVKFELIKNPAYTDIHTTEELTNLKLRVNWVSGLTI